MTEYSFCEGNWSLPRGRLHLRPLTPMGRWVKGGIDTASLCGDVQPDKGWDRDHTLKVALVRRDDRRVCPDCWDLYLRRK